MFDGRLNPKIAPADMTLSGNSAKQRLSQTFGRSRSGKVFGNAGVIAYARPFGTGSLRWNKAGLLDELGEESRKWHDHVLDLRSGYLAHSVGSWEGSYPTVEVAQSEDGSMWVEGIKCGGGRIASASSRWQNQSIDLVDEVTRLLSAMIEVERSALKTLAASWPIEHIIARGTIGGRGTRPGPNPRLPPRKPYQG